MRFSADRAQLTPEQLRTLDTLRLIGRPEESDRGCGGDGLGCNVAITSDNGDLAQYGHGSFCDDSIPVLASAPVDALLEQIGCKFALESVEPLSPSVGCFHGMHAGNSDAIQQRLSLPEANRSYHVELDYCSNGSFALELFDTDSSLPLAVGSPISDHGARGTCAALDVEVGAATIAELVITPTSNDGIGSDFSLTFR